MLTLIIFQADPWQMKNLLSSDNDPEASIPNGKLLNHPLSKVVPRLNALLLVLKSCKASTCTDPWGYLHPKGNVHSLPEALNHQYDQFYESQPKVMFTECKEGYLLEYEGPQRAMQYRGS